MSHKITYTFIGFAMTPMVVLVMLVFIAPALLTPPPTLAPMSHFTTLYGDGNVLPSLMGMAKSAAGSYLSNLPRANMECINKVISSFTEPFGTNESYALLMHSGRKANDLGEYENCRQSETSYYVLGGLSFEGVGAAFSMCLPKECKISDFDPLKQAIVSMLKSASPFPVTEDNVFFYDVNKENIDMGKTGTGFAFIMLFTLAVIIITVIATIYDIYGTKSPDPSALAKVLLAFSLPKNIESLFNTKNKVDPNLEIFNGVRVFSMIWIIFGHGYAIESLGFVFNTGDMMKTAIDDYFMSFLKIGMCGVDVFFFLSGFLSALGFYGLLSKTRSIIAVLIAFLKRYLRLFPLLFLAVMYAMFVITTEKNEPFSPSIKLTVKNCEDNWLQTLLYVNNFQDNHKYCVAWTWYLMNDMQFFIITPLLILPFLSSKKLGTLVLGICAAVSLFIQCIIMSSYNLNSSMSKISSENDYMKLYYVKPYCRIIPYLIGIFVYFIYADSKSKEKEDESSLYKKIGKMITATSWFKYILYIAGIALMILPSYMKYYLDKYPNSWGQGYATFFEVSYRVFFVLGFVFVILPSLLGQGKILTACLGSPVFSPLAKFTYGVYLGHPFFFYFTFYYTLFGHYFNHVHTFTMVMSVMFASYVLSFFATALYESPVVQLMKLFAEPKKELPDSKESSKPINEKTESLLTKKEE